jgi:hypothetical protein
MGVHADGSGAYWTETSPDADQPHGLTYREFQDVRVGVRKRLQKEHVLFADATVGGEHLPGGVAMLAMELTDQGGDCTSGFVQDGTTGGGRCRGHGLGWGWDGSQDAALYCCTADWTAAHDWTKVQLNPAQIWDNSIIWPSKAQAFASSVCVAGYIKQDGTTNFRKNVDISGYPLTIRAGDGITTGLDVSGYSYFTGYLLYSGLVATPSIVAIDKYSELRVDSSVTRFGAGANNDAASIVRIDTDISLVTGYNMTVAGDISFKTSGKLTCSTKNVYVSPVFVLADSSSYGFTHNLDASRIISQLYCCTCDASGDATALCASVWRVTPSIGYGNVGCLMYCTSNDISVRAGSSGVMYDITKVGANVNTRTLMWCKFVCVAV